MDYAIEIRAIDGETAAGRRERRRYDIDGTDVAVLLTIDGEAVAWCDDYRTAHLIAGTEATPTQEDVETLMAAVETFWEAIV